MEGSMARRMAAGVAAFAAIAASACGEPVQTQTQVPSSPIPNATAAEVTPSPIDHQLVTKLFGQKPYELDAELKTLDRKEIILFFDMGDWKVKNPEKPTKHGEFYEIQIVPPAENYKTRPLLMTQKEITELFEYTHWNTDQTGNEVKLPKGYQIQCRVLSSTDNQFLRYEKSESPRYPLN